MGKQFKQQIRFLKSMHLDIQTVMRVKHLIAAGKNSFEIADITGLDYAKVLQIKYSTQLKMYTVF